MRDAVELIKRFEGFRPKPYRCSAGVWTIGYGTTFLDGKPVCATTPEVDEETAARLLTLTAAAIDVRIAKRGPASSAGQLAALTSFAYNFGTGALFGSTLFRAHLQGDRDKVASEFPKWKFAGGRVLPGLVLRRAAEANLYSSRAQ